MSTKPLRSLEKSFLAGRGTVSSHKYTASGKSSLTKSRKPSDDSQRIHHETQSSFFPQRQDRRDITSRKKLVVDPKTGKLRYPSLLFQKIALKESIKKSLTKGSVVRGDSEEDDVEEAPFEGTARELSGSRRSFGGVGMDESRYFVSTSKDIEPRRSALYHHNDAEEVSSAGEDEAADDEFLENRKYSMYEDWRIIETIDEQIREHGIKGYLSKGLWKTLIDPRTGSRLLDGTRTPESMRERYKKWLVLLTEEDKEELRRFARRHNEAEMKNSCCSFRKVDRTRRFDGVAEDAMGTYSTLKFINTPRKSSSKKMTQSARYTEEKPALPKVFVTRPGGESEVRERLVFTERKADKRKESAEASRVHTTVKKSPAKIKEAISTLKRLYIPVLDDDDVETVEKQRILDAEKLSKKNDQGEFRPRSKKIQRIYETPEAGKVDYREIPGGKRLDFSQINLKDRLASGVKGRGYIIEDLSKSDEEELIAQERFEQRPADPNLNVYVDMNRMAREFVKEKDERGRHTIKLIKIAEKYGLKLDDALKLFNAVSGDYEDLKLYLQNGDVNLLWTEDDDHGLILNNKTAIRYLKLIKGEKRMERRKMYLLGRYERRRRASHSAH